MVAYYMYVEISCSVGQLPSLVSGHYFNYSVSSRLHDEVHLLVHGDEDEDEMMKYV